MLVDGWYKAGFADIEPTADLHSIDYRQSKVILHSDRTYTIEVHQLFLYINHNHFLFKSKFFPPPDKFTFKPAQDTDGTWNLDTKKRVLDWIWEEHGAFKVGLVNLIKNWLLAGSELSVNTVGTQNTPASLFGTQHFHQRVRQTATSERI